MSRFTREDIEHHTFNRMHNTNTYIAQVEAQDYAEECLMDQRHLPDLRSLWEMRQTGVGVGSGGSAGVREATYTNESLGSSQHISEFINEALFRELSQGHFPSFFATQHEHVDITTTNELLEVLRQTLNDDQPTTVGATEMARQLITPVTDSLLIENQLCPICQEQFQGNGTGVVSLPCRHHFHQSCIGTWLHDHAECPVCRDN
ncbi:MAG: hypothetical protein K0U52_08010, partial [Gammaproteobacteria bacterium]|nr:hypothetical protein [Gammaproteobacteria bacterium]